MQRIEAAFGRSLVRGFPRPRYGTAADHHLAVLAHDKSKLVRVNGDVHIRSKSAQLLNPTNVGVIEVEDLL
jgi:hypothetical protein